MRARQERNTLGAYLLPVADSPNGLYRYKPFDPTWESRNCYFHRLPLTKKYNTSFTCYRITASEYTTCTWTFKRRLNEVHVHARTALTTVDNNLYMFVKNRIYRQISENHETPTTRGSLLGLFMECVLHSPPWDRTSFRWWPIISSFRMQHQSCSISYFEAYFFFIMPHAALKLWHLFSMSRRSGVVTQPKLIDGTFFFFSSCSFKGRIRQHSTKWQLSRYLKWKKKPFCLEARWRGASRGALAGSHEKKNEPLTLRPFFSSCNVWFSLSSFNIHVRVTSWHYLSFPQVGSLGVDYTCLLSDLVWINMKQKTRNKHAALKPWYLFISRLSGVVS